MPRAKAKAKAKAKARAQRAAQVEASNERRDRRVAAVRELNRLAAEVGAKPVNRHRPTAAKVETLVRVLQRRSPHQKNKSAYDTASPGGRTRTACRGAP